MVNPNFGKKIYETMLGLLQLRLKKLKSCSTQGNSQHMKDGMFSNI